MKNYGFTLLAALLGLFYSTLLPATDSAQENPLLTFVPADTLFFTGNTQLVNITDYPLTSFSPSFETPMSQSDRVAMAAEPAFFYELFLDFENILQQGNLAVQRHYGLSDKIAAVAYTVGLTPVIKLSLADEQAFLKVLDKAEKKSGFQHKSESFENVSYRSYSINDKYQLIVAMQKSANGQKLVTIALLSNTVTEQSKKLILGLSQPKQSIANTGKLSSIQQANHYLPLSVSFLDFQELVKSLFQKKNNPWVDLLDDKQLIAYLQASNCAADVMAIAKEVPRIVAGYKKYQVQGQHINMDFEVLLELKNQNIKTELNNFRGFIPDYIRSGAKEHILAFGLGANMSQLSPMFVYISKAFRESSFKCQALIEMQNDVAEFNPAMLALVTGVVDGVHGVSFAIQDLKLSTATGAVPVQKVDLSMVVSMAAENPLKVWQMMAAFVPQMATISPSEKPQKLNFPELDALGLNVFVAIKGQNLVLYSGEKAAAISQQLVNEKIVSNGFFHESLNYSKLTTAVKEVRDYMSAPDSQQALPAEACNYMDESIAMLSRMSGFIDFHSDFISRGWLNTITADIKLMTPPETHYQLPGKYETYYVQDGCQLAKDGYEEILSDDTGFYQQYSDNEQCFIFEARYRWSQDSGQINLQYVSERSRPEGDCANKFTNWEIPEADFINDVCRLRATAEGDFACMYQWDDVLTKAVFKRL